MEFPGVYSVLVIDDESAIRSSFSYFLEDLGYTVYQAENGRDGLQKLQDKQPDVILTDLRMPELDGLEVLKQVASIAPETPVVVISGTGRIQDVVEALHLGAWDYLLKPVEDLVVLEHVVSRALARVVLGRENRRYQEDLEALVRERTEALERTNRELEISRRQIISILSQAAEYRDFETGNHFMRVSAICGCLARGMGWPEVEVNCMELASPVHDIGKIGIPDHILLKGGALDPDEWTEMQKHCEYGYNILSGQHFAGFALGSTVQNILTDGGKCGILAYAANIALYHHERWDGNGYPSGLAGNDIPIEARITAVADVYDAISSRRPYKDPWPQDKCLQYVRDQSGTQFDPSVVDIFFRNLDKIQAIRKSYED